jgi:PAS domain S-box-containing protein
MPPMLTGDQYRLLVEHSPTMVWRAGIDTRCDYFNAPWLAFTGRTLEQELGHGWAAAVHADDLERTLRIYLGSFERREPFEMEYRLRRHDGVYRYIFDRGVPFSDDGVRFGGYIGSRVDVQERYDVERQKMELLALIAHELQAPLVSMSTIVDSIRRSIHEGLPIDDAVFDRYRAEVQRLACPVEELSDVSQSSLTCLSDRDRRKP